MPRANPRSAPPRPRTPAQRKRTAPAYSRRAPRGFTLLEVVIAIALTAMIVLAVTAVTRTSAQTAQRVKVATTDEARLAVALKIIRRDVVGWYEPPRTAQPPNAALLSLAPGEILLSFETLADSLVPAHVAIAAPQRTGLRVEYLLCPRGEWFDLVRREHVGSRVAEITLLSTTQPVRLEFHDGTAWHPKWTLTAKPKAIRWVLNQKTCVIGL